MYACVDKYQWSQKSSRLHWRRRKENQDGKRVHIPVRRKGMSNTNCSNVHKQERFIATEELGGPADGGSVQGTIGSPLEPEQR